MAEQASGRVTYANGVPAAGVRVRVFDRDPGGTDDDLTTEPGVSDADGRFTVSYERARAADTIVITTTEPRSLFDWTLVTRTRQFTDPLDLYLPYLECRYTLRGSEHVATFALEDPPIELRLPAPPPVSGAFVPSEHGFNFLNSFPGVPLPFSIPALPGIGQIPASYGLCGGMAAAAADFFYAGRPIPATREVPGKRTALYSYLYRRQMDSFSPLGEPVLRFMKWMKMPEDAPLGTWQRSFAEFEQLKAMFDSGVPVHPIGLVFAGKNDPLWENHQVLAYGYVERSPSRIEIKIYDPNYPENDQVFIRAEKMAFRGTATTGEVTSAVSIRCSRVAMVADQLGRPVEDVRHARGIFLMPYEPVAPPEGL